MPIVIDNMALVFLVFAIIFTVLFLAIATVTVVKEIVFDMNCTQYIKRAADANTVELAKDELEKAISYAEEEDLTEGIVSIFLHQPQNDIGFWYNNMKEAYSELENLPEEATPLEKTNVLMKLRESLTDETDSGISVTMPSGISLYPYNAMYFWIGIIFVIFAIVFWILRAVFYYDY